MTGADGDRDGRSSAVDAHPGLTGGGWIAHEDPGQGFIEHVGPLWQRGEGEELEFAFVADAHHRNRRGVVQGGMLMTFADRSLGIMAWHANGRRPQATVHFDMHFLAAARIGDLVQIRGTVTRRTRSLIFTRGDIFVGDRSIATAQAIWKVLDGPSRD